MNNLKQLAIAAKQLILAFGGVLAFTQAAPNPADINAAKVPALPALLEKPWQKALWAYTLMPQIFFCPLRLEIKPGDEAAATERARRDKLTDRAKMLRVGEAYSLNEIIDGLKLNTIPKPGETVLFYEGSDGKLDFRHDGKANVAFCDGHVIAVSPADAKKLIWNPLAPDALIEAGK